MRPRIVLVGATGAFGARLAHRLARWDVDLVLAARREGPLQALRAAVAPGPACVETAVLDREAPDLAPLRPFAVVDAAGPFQARRPRLAQTAIAAGAHYVDLADARDFVSAFPAALDAEARAAGVLAVTGASSTPALSHAALDVLTRGWSALDAVTVAIAPGARAPRGLAVVQAILSYVGRPVRVFSGGRWTTRPGWSGPRRLQVPDLGPRWTALCETPDLDLIPARFAVRREARFVAGLELAPLHLGLWLLSWPVRLGLVRSLAPLAGLLRRAAGVFVPFGSDRGGMLVLAEGQGPGGERRVARWSLVAESGAGPNVPVAAAAAVLRALIDGRFTTRGAVACVGLVGLDDILHELDGLPVRTARLDVAPDEPVLFRRVMGAAFDALPPEVARVHGAAQPQTLAGQGRARGRGALAPLRWLLGLPQPGRYPALSVEVRLEGGAEAWTRRFAPHRFTSRLRPAGLGEFEERFGPIRFVFAAEPSAAGFRWRFRRWSLGPAPLPVLLGPRIRARAFARDGAYRFSVAVAHPWLGLVFAYAGRLR